ncbi:MAG: hypothetical protein ACLFP8_08925 [Alphaproteobacteria bacterium]
MKVIMVRGGIEHIVACIFALSIDFTPDTLSLSKSGKNCQQRRCPLCGRRRQEMVEPSNDTSNIMAQRRLLWISIGERHGCGFTAMNVLI